MVAGSLPSTWLMRIAQALISTCVSLVGRQSLSRKFRDKKRADERSGSPFSDVDLEAAFAGIIRSKRCGRCTATLR